MYQDIIYCPQCKEGRMEVINSRPAKNLRYQGSIHRRRKCPVCGYRVSTYELAEPDVAKIEAKLARLAKYIGGQR